MGGVKSVGLLMGVLMRVLVGLCQHVGVLMRVSVGC